MKLEKAMKVPEGIKYNLCNLTTLQFSAADCLSLEKLFLFTEMCISFDLSNPAINHETSLNKKRLVNFRQFFSTPLKHFNATRLQPGFET